ncbi:MAG: CAP domain-containing protein [Ilumatobacteraceae bacterium]
MATLALPSAARGASAPALDTAVLAGPLARAERLNPPTPAASFARQVFDLVNAQRAGYNLPPFTYDSRLELAAQRHSEDQARHQNMSHTGSDGSSMSERIERAGFAFRRAAENVAYGYRTPAAVVQAWMNSDGHRRNILSANTHIGVGVAVGANGLIYWTQNFGTPP